MYYTLRNTYLRTGQSIDETWNLEHVIGLTECKLECESVQFSFEFNFTF